MPAFNPLSNRFSALQENEDDEETDTAVNNMEVSQQSSASTCANNTTEGLKKTKKIPIYIYDKSNWTRLQMQLAPSCANIVSAKDLKDSISVGVNNSTSFRNVTT